MAVGRHICGALSYMAHKLNSETLLSFSWLALKVVQKALEVVLTSLYENELANGVSLMIMRQEVLNLADSA
jgi:hypothetical protein